MRIDLIRRSLGFYGIKSILVYEDQENFSQRIYHSFLVENILTKNAFWRTIGLVLAKRLCRFSKYSKTIILFIDVCASALPYLRKCFDRIILSVEDLTPNYRKFTKESTRRYFEIFTHLAQYADRIITPAYTLTRELKELGLEAHTVPIGLEPYVSLDEALKRELPVKILHAGQLNELEQVKTVLNLAKKYIVILHNHGRYAKLMKRVVHPNIQKYRATSPQDAVRFTKHAHIGLIISSRPAYTLSRIYFHTALLQPIIGYGSGPWITEIKELGLTLNSITEVEEIIHHYSDYVSKMSALQDKLKIPFVHNILIKYVSIDT